MTDVDTVLSTAQVAERLNLTVSQVYRRIARGDIPAHRVRRRGLQFEIPEHELEQYINAGRGAELSPLPMASNVLLGVTEVAARLQLSRETVRRMCNAGQLRHQRAGERGHFRIWPEAIDEMLDEQK